jgi:hypothetical protein
MLRTDGDAGAAAGRSPAVDGAVKALRPDIRDGVWAAIACAAAVLVSSAAVAVHGTSSAAGVRSAAAGDQISDHIPARAGGRANNVRVARNVIIVFLAIQCVRWRWGDRTPVLALALGGMKIAYAAYVFYVACAVTPGAPASFWYAYMTGVIALLGVAPFVWLVMVPSTNGGG